MLKHARYRPNLVRADRLMHSVWFQVPDLKSRLFVPSLFLNLSLFCVQGLNIQGLMILEFEIAK